MNHSFADKVDQELILLLIMLVGYLISKIKKPKKGSRLAANDAVIREAKLWYDRTYRAAGDAKLSKQLTEKYANDWNKKFRPDWLEAQGFYECESLIIEIPALKNGEMILSFSRPDSPDVDFNKPGTVTSLLIVKRKTDFNLYAMTIVASAAHLKANHGRLGNNTYQKKDENFEGAVFFNKMDGTFVNGWLYQNGKATRQLYPLRRNSSGVRLTGKRCKPDAKLSSYRSSLTIVALWEDRLYSGDKSNAYNCNTYITSNVYADRPISIDITTPGGINESLAIPASPYTLPSRFRIEQELQPLKAG
jgi:hypothetical protein